MTDKNELTYSSADFKSDQEVRWCPGCGDYSILVAIQRTLPKLNIPKEDIVFISGIGCSSRFPYYMNSYGFHTIHGRAPAIATGVKLANPNLSVWMVTGDGDALSIGGNHFIHLMRRNVDINVLLFNNEIYGLTKGQVSPTSHPGTKTKTSPIGSFDRPVNPTQLATASGASFVARTIDRDPKHMAKIFEEAEKHRGTSFIEIYQNCVIFNDGVFDVYSDKTTKKSSLLHLEDQKPLIFDDGKKGIMLDGFQAKVIDLERNANSTHDLYVHQEKPEHDFQSYLYGMMTESSEFPTPIGIFHRKTLKTQDQNYSESAKYFRKEEKTPTIKDLIHSGNTWTVSSE